MAILATGNLTDAQHFCFLNDTACHPCIDYVTITREGELTTISTRDAMLEVAEGEESFTKSLKSGLLHYLGYSILLKPP